MQILFLFVRLHLIGKVRHWKSNWQILIKFWTIKQCSKNKVNCIH